MLRSRFAVAILTALIFVSPARAELKIDITKGNIEPMPIAITTLTGLGTNEASGAAISAVIAADLERSGLFRPINKQAFIENVTNGDAIPRYADWRQINANAVITGTVTPTSAATAHEASRVSTESARLVRMIGTRAPSTMPAASALRQMRAPTQRSIAWAPASVIG